MVVIFYVSARLYRIDIYISRYIYLWLMYSLLLLKNFNIYLKMKMCEIVVMYLKIEVMGISVIKYFLGIGKL